MQSLYTAKAISSLEKVFPDTEPPACPEAVPLTALRGETVSFQVAFHSGDSRRYARASVICPRGEAVELREVVTVPCRYPAHAKRDAGYLRTEPGLYPDLLRKPPGGLLRLVPGRWKSLWVDFTADRDMPPGDVPVTVALLDMESGGELCRAEVAVELLDATLPEQTFPRTEWFHGDCLADYYGVEVFSPRHWEIMESFIRTAVRRGINMILTPQFTPPLDIRQGGERTAIQLVDVAVENSAYRFGFEKLRRWVDMCEGCGVRYYEMSHLFTQWGAQCAPKVMANVDGQYRQLFGWDSPATGGEYTRFLHAYLPALTERLNAWGLRDRVYFHISDEPTRDQLESYKAAKESVAHLLGDFPIMDAISDYAFYETGVMDTVVCANDHIEPFLAGGVENLWAYYCTSQCVDVSNRFFSLPSARNRIYGVQLYKYDIKGALHWGYNFYNAQYSLHPIDPFFETDAGEAFPGGDPFLVYPAADGTPLESIRMMVLAHAMADLRALRLLESLRGRVYVLSLIEEGLTEPLTFSRYPADTAYLLRLRARVNREIAAASGS